jgi:outer membrane protein assembly factor BamB
MKPLIPILFTALAYAADWPQWRGPQRDGKSTETGLRKQWPADGPPLLWQASGLGEGYAAIAVRDGRIFTQGQKNGKQFVMAIDENSGNMLWQVENGGTYMDRRGNGPRGTPATEPGKLWAYSASGNISCLDPRSGKPFWSFNALEKFGGSIPRWGISESPLIDGDNMILVTGGTGASVVALNKNTGGLVWKSQSDPAGYSSAVLAQTGSIRQVLAFTMTGALGLRADNGELLWRYDNVVNRTATVATPIYHNGHVFYSSDYGTGCALLKLTPDGGGVRATEVYFNKDMRNHHATSILVGNHLYGFSGPILTAMEFQTGTVAWRDRSVGKGHCVFADGNLYCLSENGVMGLIEATQESYKEKARFSINTSGLPTWAPPVIANGRMYLRDQDKLYCYDIRERK